MAFLYKTFLCLQIVGGEFVEGVNMTQVKDRVLVSGPKKPTDSKNGNDADIWKTWSEALPEKELQTKHQGTKGLVEHLQNKLSDLQKHQENEYRSLLVVGSAEITRKIGCNLCCRSYIGAHHVWLVALDLTSGLSLKEDIDWTDRATRFEYSSVGYTVGHKSMVDTSHYRESDGLVFQILGYSKSCVEDLENDDLDRLTFVGDVNKDLEYDDDSSVSTADESVQGEGSSRNLGSNGGKSTTPRSGKYAEGKQYKLFSNNCTTFVDEFLAQGKNRNLSEAFWNARYVKMNYKKMIIWVGTLLSAIVGILFILNLLMELKKKAAMADDYL